MTLAPGTRLGPYHVVSMLGMGGMGEVYKARDSRLKRDVALKVLPESFSTDSERLARFEREAEVLAALNHPHIAAIYGVQDADGLTALVMELVDGEELSARIARGPIPLDEALSIARQIGQALDTAHQCGIIHRDLKPANIKVRPDGTVKVLDFGLAKMADVTIPDSSNSPTLTSPAMTARGVILGTAAYMSPEQARGQKVDKRADIWAFGVVLCEMLTGWPVFPGEDVAQTVAAILTMQPDLGTVPRVARRLVSKCLEKDPARRLRDIADAWELLENPDAETPRRASTLGARLITSAVLVLTGVALGLLIWFLAGSGRPAAPRVTRFVDSLPEGRSLPRNVSDSKILAISPDGRTLVYRARDAGRFRLFRRFLDQPYAESIGDDEAEEPFFSSDGEWVGYQVGTTLKRVPVRGGPAYTIADLPSEYFRGADWTADGMITLGGLAKGLWRVSEKGGEIVTLKEPPAGRFVSDPQVLPGGRAVLYTEGAADSPDDTLQILDLEKHTSRRLLPGAAGRYLPTGHLVYTSGGALRAVAFDLARLEVRGTPIPVVEGIRGDVTRAPEHPFGASELVHHAIAARAGVLAYVPEPDAEKNRALVWVDRQGREQSLGIEPRNFGISRVSPDGTRVAVTITDKSGDIWIWNAADRNLKQLTFDSTPNYGVAWFPDGKRVAFSAIVNGINQVFSQPADGSGVPARITQGPIHTIPMTFSRDGQLIVAELYWKNDNVDVALQSLRDSTLRRTLGHTPAAEVNATVSPDDRWFAYDANESGQFEVYVRPFPNVDSGERHKVSSSGGCCPGWSRDGKALFYWVDRGTFMTIMTVSIASGPSFDFSSPAPAVQGQYARPSRETPYDVAPDGRFLLLNPLRAPRDEIVTVLNWTEDLKRLVPAGK
jgi:serine/threonine-protein kinase